VTAVDEATGNGPLRRSVPLAGVTTYRFGGAASWWAEPDDVAGLSAVRAAATHLGLPVIVLGRGSNVVVSDHGLDAVVVRLGRGFAATGVDADGAVIAGAAAHQPKVARFAVDRDRGGLEFLVGIPGSIGGGVRMNAGCFGSEFSDVLIDVAVFDLEDGSVSTRPADSLGMSYRSTNLTDRHVVVSARLRTESQPAELGRRRMREITRRRRLTQPGGTLNAGSVFKNPPGDAAGRLIDAAGLKGLTVGGARVSPRHANFFEATEGASAQDVFDLVAEVRRRVRAESGQSLEPEIRFLGAFDPAPAGNGVGAP
jgi:UDP-N-acetylmuramate dehydrogenase